MRKGVLAAAAVLAGSSAAIAGGNLIRSSEKPAPPRDGLLHRAGLAVPPSGPWSPAWRALPEGKRALGTLASAKLGSAIPALRAAVGESAVLVFDPTEGHIVRARGIAMPPAVPGEPRESALEFLRDHFQAFGLAAAPERSWFTDDIEGVAGTHHFGVQQYADDGIPLYGAIVTVHTDALGAPLLVQSEAVPTPETIRPARPIDASIALLRAGERLGVSASTRLVYYRPEGAGAFKLCYQVDVGADRTFVDAATGLVLERIDRRCYAPGDANVWDPNPLGASESCSAGARICTGTDNPANTTTENLANLDGSGALRGSVCAISDRVNPVASATGGSFTGFTGTGNPSQVEQTSVYFYITDESNAVQIAAANAGVNFGQMSRFYPLSVILDIPDDNGQNQLANAFFDPSNTSLQFGQGEDGLIVNIERDIDVASHEFGHFIESVYAPDDTPRQNSPRRGMGEGFGDFTAAFHNNAAAGRGGGVGAACIGDSTIPTGASTRQCLRYVQSNGRTISQTDGEEHNTGEVVAQALYGLAAKMGGGGVNDVATSAGLNNAYPVFLAGVGFLPRANAQFADLVDALRAGDAARAHVPAGQGPNEQSIVDTFSAHDIFGTQAPPSNQTSGGGQTPSDVPVTEIFLGIPVDVSLPANGLARYVLAIPTDTATVFDVSLTSSNGGVAIVACAPANWNGNSNEIVASTATAMPQAIEITASGATGKNQDGSTYPSTTPAVGDDIYFLVDVLASTGGTFTLSTSNTGPNAATAKNEGTFTGTTITDSDSIDTPAEVDLFYFTGTKNQIVGVTVERTSGDLIPEVLLLDTSFKAIAGDASGLLVTQAKIDGAPLPADGRYIVAVTAWSPENKAPETTGGYTLDIHSGTLAGTAFVPTGTAGTEYSRITDSVTDGESKVYNITIDQTKVSRLDFFLRPVNPTTTGDIDLYMTPANSTSPTFEFASNKSGSVETVGCDTGSSPSIRSSDFWYVVVFGFDVSALRSRVAGQSEAFTLDAVTNTPSSSGGGGGGGGCALAAMPERDGSLLGLWLPAAALVGAILLLRRRQ